jgi:hypothetical protein
MVGKEAASGRSRRDRLAYGRAATGDLILSKNKLLPSLQPYWVLTYVGHTRKGRYKRLFVSAHSEVVFARYAATRIHL